MPGELEQRFLQIIRNEDWLVRALREAGSLGLPDWYIAAGAIRNTVWNVLHGYPGAAHLKDVDVIYFDPLDGECMKEKDSEDALNAMDPSLRWEVVNQVRLRRFNPGRPDVRSSCESVAYWSETPTCVGVRMEKDGSLTTCAPHGLGDLMGLVVRPIPEPYRDLDLYRRRISSKHWDTIWPNLKIIRV
jgi:hypothetical protein